MITSLLTGRALSGKNNIKVISRVYYAAEYFYLKKYSSNFRKEIARDCFA